MTEAVVDKRSLSTEERFLVSLGIRPREAPLVSLLFSNMFLSGIAIGMIRVCAFTLFLKYFASEQLAVIAILLAFTGTLVTLAIERSTRQFSTQAYLYTVLGTIFLSVILIRLTLGSFSNNSLIFALPLFFEIIYMLFSLQFIALLTRLLNVRQTKRLSGLTRSGEFLAEMVGGLSIVVLLDFMQVEDLLWVAALAIAGVFLVVRATVKRFTAELSSKTTHATESEGQGRMMSMLKLPYVQLIALCYSAFIFAYFFLDVAFYKYAAVQFPDPVELAGFIGQFFAIAGFLTMLTMIFIFAPFLRKFGMLAGVLAFPVLIGAGSIAISTMEFGGVDVSLIFIVMVATNALRVILQSAIWRPSVGILFQVLPDRQRSLGTSLIEGIVDPLASGLAGVALFIVSEQLNWEPKLFLLLLAGLMGGWIICGFLIRRMYLSNLVETIQKRKLGGLNINQLDNASIEIILRGLESNYPAEIFYCLNLLEEIEHPDITHHIQNILSNKNEAVRLNVLQRIERMQSSELATQVFERIDEETDPQLLGQVLRTYAALGQENTIDTLTPFLDHKDVEVRLGALVGILSHNPQMESSQNYLLDMVRSEDAEKRGFAADVLGAIGSKTFSGYLIELLDDLDQSVTDRAIVAAGNVKDERLVGKLVSKLSNPSLLGRVGTAIHQHGEGALYDLDRGLADATTSRQAKRKIIEILKDIDSPQTVDILLQHIYLEEPELRHQIFVSLAHRHYQAKPDDRYIFVNMLDEEVEILTWLLATMEDLWDVAGAEKIHSAMAHELDVHRDNMLLLTSFIFSSIVMLDTRANIDSNISELRVFALEVLDNLLTNEVKQIVIPLLDDLTVSERLEKLGMRFPQSSLSANDRIENIISTHFDQAFYWTRAVLLQHIGKHKLGQHEELVRSCLKDPEPLVRETALWALSELGPDDIRRTLRGFTADASKEVQHIVSALLARLQPEIDPDTTADPV